MRAFLLATAMIFPVSAVAESDDIVIKFSFSYTNQESESRAKSRISLTPGIEKIVSGSESWSYEDDKPIRRGETKLAIVASSNEDETVTIRAHVRRLHEGYIVSQAKSVLTTGWDQEAQTTFEGDDEVFRFKVTPISQGANR